MILHLFSYEKFALDYILKINKLFDQNEHLFFVIGNKVEEALDDIKSPNVIFSSSFSNKMLCMFEINKYIILSEKVIFHSMFFGTLALIDIDILGLVFGHKFFWNIWGFDLYNEYRNRKKRKLFHLGMTVFVREIKSVGYIKGDYDYLLAHFKTNAKFFLASYAYNFDKKYIKYSKNKSDKINILIGNSCNLECQYEEALAKIKKIEDKRDKKIYCLLSYPKNNNEYRNEIIKYGTKLFKEDFIPVVEYVGYNEYMNFLSDIDVAIFNHNRQQALGNIALLLFLGKKVFINPMNACFQYFSEIGATVYSTKDLHSEECFDCINVEQAKRNTEVISDFFSDKSFYTMWDNIFRNGA